MNSGYVCQLIIANIHVSQNIKLLITSGCSFSQVPNSDVTWPVPLGKALNVETEYNGRGAVGNDIISKSIIHKVSLALEKYNTDEILVGIMWSGMNRHAFYLTKQPPSYNKIATENSYYQNPQWIANPQRKCHYLIGTHWDDDLSKTYIKTFYDNIGSQIETIEHILRVQWFLKLNNIKYFMTCYSTDVLVPYLFSKNKDALHLYNLIDKNHFLKYNLLEYNSNETAENMNTWSQKTGLPYRDKNDIHPSTDMHQLLVDSIILPHLREKGYIYGNT